MPLHVLEHQLQGADMRVFFRNLSQQPKGKNPRPIQHHLWAASSSDFLLARLELLVVE
jgi:hypothetical protein